MKFCEMTRSDCVRITHSDMLARLVGRAFCGCFTAPDRPGGWEA